MRKLASADFASGLLFIAFGMLGIALSLQESIGTAARMGSGFMPLLLSCGLTAMGLLILINGLREAAEIGPPFGFRGLAVVLLSIAVFASSMRNFGLGPAVFFATAIASYAEKGRKPLQVLLFAALLSLFCSAVFIWGLGLTIPVVVTSWIS